MRRDLSVSRIQTRSSTIWESADDSCHAPWPTPCWSNTMPDILWIGLILGLVAASLGYARLCDDA